MASISSCIKRQWGFMIVLRLTESVLLFLSQSLDLQGEQVLLDTCRPPWAAGLLEFLELLVMLMHISVSLSVGVRHDDTRQYDLLVDEVLCLGQLKRLTLILLSSLLEESDPVD